MNLSKSSVAFSANVSLEVQTEMQNRLGMERANPQSMYLGLPSFVGAKKRRVFQALKEQLWKRIHMWKGQLFSSKGKEILLKAVALSLPNYSMQVFRLPDSIQSEMEGMMARF